MNAATEWVQPFLNGKKPRERQTSLTLRLEKNHSISFISRNTIFSPNLNQVHTVRGKK